MVAGYKLRDPKHITPHDTDFPHYFAEREIVIEDGNAPPTMEMTLKAVDEKGKVIGATDKVQSLIPQPAEPRELVVTVFGKDIYLDQITPSETQMQEGKTLPATEFEAWLQS